MLRLDYQGQENMIILPQFYSLCIGYLKLLIIYKYYYL